MEGANPTRPGMPPIEPTVEPVGFQQTMAGAVDIGEAMRQVVNGVEAPPVPVGTATQATQTPQPAPQQTSAQVAPSVTAAGMISDFLSAAMAPQPPVPAPPPAAPVVDRYNQEEPSATQYQPMPEQPMPDIQPPQNLQEQQGHAWAQLRAAVKNSHKQAEDARAEYNKAVETIKSMQDQIEALKKDIAAKDDAVLNLENEIGTMDLSRSPVFKEKYKKLLAAEMDTIVDAYVQSGYGREEAADYAATIAVMPENDVPEYLEKLPPYTQGMILVSRKNIGKIMADRSDELSDWRNSKAAYEEVGNRSDAMRSSSTMTRLANNAIEFLRALPAERGRIPSYQVADPEFSQERTKRESQFRSWYAKAPEEQRVVAAAEGFMAPLVYQMYAKLEDENRMLRQLAASHRSLSNPAVRSMTVAPSTPPPPKPTQPAPIDQSGTAETFVKGAFQQFFGQ